MQPIVVPSLALALANAEGCCCGCGDRGGVCLSIRHDRAAHEHARVHHPSAIRSAWQAEARALKKGRRHASDAGSRLRCSAPARCRRRSISNASLARWPPFASSAACQLTFTSGCVDPGCPRSSVTAAIFAAKRAAVARPVSFGTARICRRPRHR